jgi:hypothetical protein
MEAQPRRSPDERLTFRWAAEKLDPFDLKKRK